MNHSTENRNQIDPDQRLAGPHWRRATTLPVEQVRLWLDRTSDAGDLSIRDVAAFVAQHPALTTAVLRGATSAFTGLTTSELSVVQAVALLGVRNTRAILLRLLADSRDRVSP